MGTEILFNELLADAEKVLKNSTHNALLVSAHSLVSGQPADIRKRSDTDLEIMSVLAALALVYIAKRKEEAEKMNANH